MAEVFVAVMLLLSHIYACVCLCSLLFLCHASKAAIGWQLHKLQQQLPILSKCNLGGRTCKWEEVKHMLGVTDLFWQCVSVCVWESCWVSVLASDRFCVSFVKNRNKTIDCMYHYAQTHFRVNTIARTHARQKREKRFWPGSKNKKKTGESLVQMRQTSSHACEK